MRTKKVEPKQPKESPDLITIALMRGQDGFDARLNHIGELYFKARRRGDVARATELALTYSYLRQGEREWQAEQLVLSAAE
jgi:hypothetical protein